MKQNYDDLLLEAENSNLFVTDVDFSSEELKGLYCDGCIGLKRGLKTAEKACVLAEELGHYYTSSGDILDQSNVMNRKQEKIARKWAVHKLIKIDDFIEAIKSGYESLYDIAEYLETTVDFLREAIDVFRREYGARFQRGDYVITFNDVGLYVINITEEEWYY